MVSLLRFATARSVLAHPLRPLLTSLGIALATALFVAIALINRATLDYFRETVYSISGSASLSVVGSDETGVPEDLLEVVRAVPGVKSAAPMIEARASFERRTMVVFGVDLLADGAVRSYRTSDEKILDDPLIFLNQADSVVVTVPFAEAQKLGLESQFDLMTAHGNKRFTVRGLINPTGAAKAFGRDLVLMDIDGARVMFGKEGKTDRIDITTRDGADTEAVAAAVERAVGPTCRVERPEQQVAALESLVRGYQAVLSILSTLALIVAFFLVVNAVAIAVAQRRGEIGVLRALGATRAQVMFVFAAEGLLMGLVGGAVGVLLGRGVANVLAKGVGASLAAQYARPIQLSSLALTSRGIVQAVAVATIVSTLAALIPAFRATRVPTVEAFSREDRTTERGPVRFSLSRALGVALLLYLLVHPRVEESLPKIGPLAALAAIVGSLLTAPLIVDGLLRFLSVLVRPGGPLEGAGILRLACVNLQRETARTGRQLLTLVVALMLVTITATESRSFAETIDAWLMRQVGADLLISSNGRFVSRQVEPIHEDIAKEIDQAKGVWSVDGRGARGFRFISLPFGKRTVMLKAWDRPHPAVHGAVFDVVSGKREDAERAEEALYNPADANEPSAIVSEAFVRHFDKRVGSTLELPTPSGLRRFRIVAEVVDFGMPDGTIFVSRDVYKRWWGDPLVTGFAVKVEPGSDLQQVKDAIGEQLAGGASLSRGLVTIDATELRKQMADVITESFAYHRAIQFAALVVALLGLFTTALASALHRGRELGVLRAVGTTSGQLQRMLMYETMILGASGGFAAVALGLYVAEAYVIGAVTRAIGWVITICVPWSWAVSTVCSGLVIGVIAGGLVARGALRVPIQEALSHE